MYYYKVIYYTKENRESRKTSRMAGLDDVIEWIRENGNDMDAIMIYCMQGKMPEREERA